MIRDGEWNGWKGCRQVSTASLAGSSRGSGAPLAPCRAQACRCARSEANCAAQIEEETRLNALVPGPDDTTSGQRGSPATPVPVRDQSVISVVATQGTGTKAGVGILAAAVQLGASGQSQAEKSASNRVKFSVPLVLPPVPKGLSPRHIF